MNPRICKIKHNPPKAYGDCIRACIATMLNDDNVPHTFNGDDEQSALQGWQILRNYLETKNKTLTLIALDEHWDFMTENNPTTTYMLLCKVKDGDHAVVCRNGKVVHDPAWYKTEILGPHSYGFWIIGLLGDLIV